MNRRGRGLRFAVLASLPSPSVYGHSGIDEERGNVSGLLGKDGRRLTSL